MDVCWIYTEKKCQNSSDHSVCITICDKQHTQQVFTENYQAAALWLAASVYELQVFMNEDFFLSWGISH